MLFGVSHILYGVRTAPMVPRLFGLMLLLQAALLNGCDHADGQLTSPGVGFLLPAVRTGLQHGDIQKPTDIIYFHGKYVSPELNRNRLAIFDDLDFSGLRHFDPKVLKRTFKAPHYLAESPWGTLLISNGWGRNIVEIADLEGKHWKSFSGVGKRFKAPHGIAVDDRGWIYVGDSLNSRIVRFRDMAGNGWQVFDDVDKRVAYTRQLVWKDGALWVSNSYEKRDGLNPGVGANVLRIDDFESGRATVEFEWTKSNITGIYPDGQRLLVAVWGTDAGIIAVDLATGRAHRLGKTQCELGVPYSIRHDPARERFLVTYFGDFEGNNGGFLLMEE